MLKSVVNYKNRYETKTVINEELPFIFHIQKAITLQQKCRGSKNPRKLLFTFSLVEVAVRILVTPCITTWIIQSGHVFCRLLTQFCRILWVFLAAMLMSAMRRLRECRWPLKLTRKLWIEMRLHLSSKKKNVE